MSVCKLDEYLSSLDAKQLKRLYFRLFGKDFKQGYMDNAVYYGQLKFIIESELAKVLFGEYE